MFTHTDAFSTIRKHKFARAACIPLDRNFKRVAPHSNLSLHFSSLGRRAIVPGLSSLYSLNKRALSLDLQMKTRRQRHRGSPNYLPQKCREDAAPFLKEPRWTEQRLQYDLFREALRHPLVTSRGIPELLNHCGPVWRRGGARRGGATGDMAQTAYYPTKEDVKTRGHNSQCRL